VTRQKPHLILVISACLILRSKHLLLALTYDRKVEHETKVLMGAPGKHDKIIIIDGTTMEIADCVPHMSRNC